MMKKRIEVLENRCVCVFVCVHVCVHVQACQLPCSLYRVKVIGGAQEKKAMEEGLAKDAITVAAEQEEAAKDNSLTHLQLILTHSCFLFR